MKINWRCLVKFVAAFPLSYIGGSIVFSILADGTWLTGLLSAMLRPQIFEWFVFVLVRLTVLVDVTGLAKPAIFHAIRDELIRVRCVYVAYTAAEQYFPREEDLAKVLDAEKGDDHHRLLEALRDVLTGEEAPYSCRPLLLPNADETRGRGLCAFSSAKQERLLNLLDDRDYDAVDILVNQADRPRTRVSLIAAEVATQNNRNTSVTVCPAEDPSALLEELGRRYDDWYVARGLNFELGLTGNKMQTVAAAALSAAVKVNQCWYVSPARFDSGRFTIGVGATKYIRIGFAEPTYSRCFRSVDQNKRFSIGRKIEYLPFDADPHNHDGAGSRVADGVPI